MMARKCKCVKDYKVTARKDKNDPVFLLTIFNNNEEYYFYNKGELFYVTTKPNYLKDMDRYNIFIEELSEDEFDNHFTTEKKYNTKTPVVKTNVLWKSSLITYNNLVDKLVSNDIDELKKKSLKTAEYMLGLGEQSGFFDYQNKNENNFTKTCKICKRKE